MPPEFDRSVFLIAENIRNALVLKERIVVAIAGPPATGKSTISEALVECLNSDAAETACVVPMDGFHLDNVILDQQNLRSRKGSPETFDFYGFASLLSRIRDKSKCHYYPIFDRPRDVAFAGAGIVGCDTKVVVVEGNYLLLDQEPWNALVKMFDHTVFIGAPMDILEQRLCQRWLDNGFSLKEAHGRAKENDIPNAKLVMKKRIEPNTILNQQDRTKDK